MITVKFDNIEYELGVTSDGFRLRKSTTKDYEYVKKEHILKLVQILNGTFGYKGQPGRLYLNLPISEREGFNMTNQAPIFHNTAFVLMVLYDEVKIDGKFVVSDDLIDTSEYEKKCIKMLKKAEENSNVIKIESKNLQQSVKKDVSDLRSFMKK